MTRIPYLASLPADLDTAAALRQAATFYDDAAGNRIVTAAQELREELRAMQNANRAENVMVKVLQILLDCKPDEAWNVLRMLAGEALLDV